MLKSIDSRSFQRYIALLSALSLMLLFNGIAVAQSATEIPSVTVTTTEDGIDFPSEISAGLVNITIDNSLGEAAFTPIFARLNDGVTMDDFFASQSSDDPMAGVFLVTTYGGTSVPNGESLSFVTDLLPGDYLILTFDGSAMPLPFTVVENDMEQPEPPEADVTLAMVDFAFGVPAQIEAGPQVWNLRNFGEQFHEMSIIRIPDDTTLQEMHDAILSADPAGGDQSSYEPVFFWAPIGVGTQSWVTIDLEPGSYAIICGLPDINGDFAPHMAHGMMQIFTVA